MAGLTGSAARRNFESKTPLIPDEIFCTLFGEAFKQVQQGDSLLDLRDDLEVISYKYRKLHPHAIYLAKSRYLSSLDKRIGLAAFQKSILKLRTACYIVLASTSGCRNHELANLKSGAHHRTQDDDGTIYHWMRSKSEKTDAGVHDWMVPEAAVRALRVMERWAVPSQEKIASEIAERRRRNPNDPEIAKALQHHLALFLGKAKGHPRTVPSTTWDAHLKEFAKDLGLDWKIASHQFRRKFASYVGHSQFGDLRYLREHFAHWTLDMSLGYAIDRDWGQHLDTELYEAIYHEHETIKLGVVEKWLVGEPLAGRYGRSITHWQRDPSNLAIFSSHAVMVASVAESTAIRSNGHAWCTADDNRCVGNTLESTRCSDCSNAVIGRGHAAFYQHYYENLRKLLDCAGIGDGGRQRIQRDLDRCRDVLVQLGYSPQAKTE
jgi:hypothetical protein